MRKFLVFLMLFVSFIQPCLAGNVLQQEYELKVVSSYYSNPVLQTVDKKALFRDDYTTHQMGGISFYDKCLEARNTAPSLDKKYLNIIIKNYEVALKAPDSYQMQRLIIDDKDYEYLNFNTKKNIAVYNLMAF